MPRDVFASLPTELCCEIFSHLHDRTDLANLSLTNKQINTIVIPILYGKHFPRYLSWEPVPEDYNDTQAKAWVRKQIPDYIVNNRNKSLWKSADLDGLFPRSSRAGTGAYIGMKYIEHFTGLENIRFFFLPDGYDKPSILREVGATEGGLTLKEVQDAGATTCQLNLENNSEEGTSGESTDPLVYDIGHDGDDMIANGKYFEREPDKTKLMIHKFKDSVLINLKVLEICTALMDTMEAILECTPRLEVLTVRNEYMDSFLSKSANLDFGSMFAKTVGQTLVTLELPTPPREPNDGQFKKFCSSIGDRSAFPHLQIVNIDISEEAQMNYLDERKRISIRPYLDLCKASKRHGGWKMSHLCLAFSVGDFKDLSSSDIKLFMGWLEECTWDRKQFFKIDCQESLVWDGYLQLGDMLHWSVDELRQIFDFDGLISKFESIGQPLRIRLHTLRPRMFFSDYWAFFEWLAPHLDAIAIRPRSFDDYDDALEGPDPDGEIPVEYKDLLSHQRDVIEEWGEFLGAFLQLCVSLKSFRVEGSGDSLSGVFALNHHIEQIYALQQTHKLTELDIDAGAMIQPETYFINDHAPSLGQDIEQPRMVIKQFMWISIPGPLMLSNLTRLTFRNLFILREIEMTWFFNITAKLKKLQLFKVDGLVWHIGYDPEKAGTYSFGSSDDQGDASEGGLKGKGKKKEEGATSGEPTGTEVAKRTRRKKKSKSKAAAAPASAKNLESQMSKFDIGENELDIKNVNSEGLLSWLPEKDLPTDSENNGAGPNSDTESDPDPDSEAESTISSASTTFGTDPRYSAPVNAAMRQTRITGWIKRTLINTAIKTNGQCRDVRITNVKLNAQGLLVYRFNPDLPNDMEDWLEHRDPEFAVGAEGGAPARDTELDRWTSYQDNVDDDGAEYGGWSDNDIEDSFDEDSFDEDSFDEDLY